MTNRQPNQPVRDMSDRSAAAGAPAAGRARGAAAGKANAGAAAQSVDLGYLVRDVYIKVATRPRIPGFPDTRMAGDLIAETAFKLTNMLNRTVTFEEVLKHLRAPADQS